MDAVLLDGPEHVDGLQPNSEAPAVVWVLPFWSTVGDRP
jgi:hypothetical protein